MKVNAMDEWSVSYSQSGQLYFIFSLQNVLSFQHQQQQQKKHIHNKIEIFFKNLLKKIFHNAFFLDFEILIAK